MCKLFDGIFSGMSECDSPSKILSPSSGDDDNSFRILEANQTDDHQNGNRIQNKTWHYFSPKFDNCTPNLLHKSSILPDAPINSEPRK